jgi:hypothetical protein
MAELGQRSNVAVSRSGKCEDHPADDAGLSMLLYR